jgi:hypothetical protein
MNGDQLDVLPPRSRRRVRFARMRNSATRFAFGIVAVATVAVIAAERVRIEALDREAAQAIAADAAWRSLEARAMLEREVERLALAVRELRLEDARPGTAAVIAAVADRLPERAVVDRIELVARGRDLIGSIEGTAPGEDGASFAAQLAAWPRIVGVRYAEPVAGVFTVHFVVPVDPPAASIAIGEVDDADE